MQRRTFVKESTMAAVGLALSGQLAAKGKPLTNFGVQLYTLRGDLPANPKQILKQVAGFGYKQIEGYEGPQGLWWGLKAAEFKSYIGDLGLNMVSSHCDWEKDFDRKAAEAAEVGLRYLICPYLGEQKSMDDYRRFADKFNQAGETCRKNGIRFAYHNHAYSFKTLDGQLPQDIMMGIADPSIVDFEMDMYWVAVAGLDPIACLKKHKNRYRLCHIKDRGASTGSNDLFESVTLGTGNIDYARILKSAKRLGMQYFIVEQEAYTGTTPLKAVEANAAYLKKLAI